MPSLFVFGCGYSGSVIADRLRALGWRVSATGRHGALAFDDDTAVRAALATCDHALSSVPPDAEGDPVLTRYGDALTRHWLGYLSSTGVYGDSGGAWVDESAATGGGRRSARSAADTAWLARGARVFRLPGIYGPGRSALDRVAAGTAHRLRVPGQTFSRIHVQDIAGGVVAALTPRGGRLPPAGAYNLADDLPCGQNAVIEHACRLLGAPIPPLQTLDQAGLSPAARAFYAENRRVANGKARRVLGWRPRYPTYREGLAALFRG